MASYSARPNGNGDDDEYGWKKTLPLGIKFCPTDEEIITDYLMRRSQKLEILPRIIGDLDIYKYEPQELEAYAFDHGDGQMYFFALFKRKNNGGSRGDRIVAGGKGYWKASQARTMVKNSSNIMIGTRQSLGYCYNP